MSKKIVMITGASGGIGMALVTAFASRHASILACSRKTTDAYKAFCDSTASKFGVDIERLFFDITEHDTTKSEIMAAVKKVGCPDVLVNNAGILKEVLFHMTSLDVLNSTFDANFVACFNITQLVTRMMVRHRVHGSVINITSVSAHDGVEGQAAYGASKAAVESMSKSVAKELGRYNIRVNCIAPGVTMTPMAEAMSDVVLEAYKESAYLNQLGEPLDIAEMAVFLASSSAKHITGQVIRVDGGQN